MPPGRPPKPTEAKRRDGNAGKRKLPDRASTTKVSGRADIGDYDPPAMLPPEGKALWVELVPELDSARIYDKVDRPALMALCLQWALLVKATYVLASEGLVASGSMGQLVEHPMVATVTKASTLFLRYAEQFGMTGSARARLDAFSRFGMEPGDEMAGLIGTSPRLKAIEGGKK